jgi:hypothetical protein
MKTHVLVLAVLSCALFLVGTAGADAIPFSYSGPGVAVSGNFFGTNNHDGSWTITGIDATYNQIEVSGIVAVGLDPHFLYNNLYYVSGYAPYAVDYYGIDFAVGDQRGQSVQLYGGRRLRIEWGYASILWNGGGYEFTQVSQSSFGPVIPEPTTLALFGGGLVAAGVAARRRLWG